MPWRLILTKPAEKDLAGLPKRDRMAVVDALDRFVVDPSAVDVRKLAGARNEWRLRVGHWRILVQLSNTEGLMYVMRVLPRREAYRK